MAGRGFDEMKGPTKTHHHHKKSKKHEVTGNEMADIPAFDYAGEGEGMDGTTKSHLFQMNKPHYSNRGAERFMRAHLLDILLPEIKPQPEIKTASAIKKVQHVERLALAEVDRTQREQEKAKRHEEAKADKMRRFLASMAKHKVETRMWAKDKVLEPSSKEWEIEDPDNKDLGEPESELLSEWSEGLETGPFHSLWDEFDEDEDEGFGPRETQYDNVYADVAKSTERDPNKPPTKQYNVQLQVGPKDLKKVFSTAPWRKGKVKMYDVGLSVGPKDWETIRPKSVWEKAPGFDDDHVQPGESVQTEEERLALERKDSKRADVGVLVHPLGYKELRLSLSMEAIQVEAGIQVDERDIEREQALQRGMALRDDNIMWPTNRDFTPELFELKLERYIDQCWKLDPEWMYVIKHLQQHTTNYRNKYIFEVLFSVPTVTHPVPAATASVFFVVDIGHYGHLDDQVKIHYSVEGMRYAHAPGHLPFQSKWLSSTVADKIRIQKQWKFSLELDGC